MSHNRSELCIRDLNKLYLELNNIDIDKIGQEPREVAEEQAKDSDECPIEPPTGEDECSQVDKTEEGQTNKPPRPSTPTTNSSSDDDAFYTPDPPDNSPVFVTPSSQSPLTPKPALDDIAKLNISSTPSSPPCQLLPVSPEPQLTCDTRDPLTPLKQHDVSSSPPEDSPAITVEENVDPAQAENDEPIALDGENDEPVALDGENDEPVALDGENDEATVVDGEKGSKPNEQVDPLLDITNLLLKNPEVGGGCYPNEHW